MKIVIDIPEEVYKCVMDGTYCGSLYEVLKNGVPIESETCGDCVSRQAAIEAEKEMCKHYMPRKSTYHPHIDFVIEELQKLPSVTPERPRGKWIDDGDCIICNKCHKAYGWLSIKQASNYCPDCGSYNADIKEVQDGTCE